METETVDTLHFVCRWIIRPLEAKSVHHIATVAQNLACDLLADGVSNNEKGLAVATLILKVPTQPTLDVFVSQVGLPYGLESWQPLTDAQCLRSAFSLCWPEGRANFTLSIAAIGTENERRLHTP